MANNPIIKGLNATWKFVTRGYAQNEIGGIKVKFCHIHVVAFLCQKLSSKNYLDMKVSTQ